MTREEIIQILKDARTEWQEAPKESVESLMDRNLFEWQADALLAAQSDEATIADLKERGVLVSGMPHSGNALDWRIVLPGPAMEDKK